MKPKTNENFEDLKGLATRKPGECGPQHDLQEEKIDQLECELFPLCREVRPLLQKEFEDRFVVTRSGTPPEKCQELRNMVDLIERNENIEQNRKIYNKERPKTNKNRTEKEQGYHGTQFPQPDEKKDDDGRLMDEA